MASILDEREITDAERAAIADEPRPGVWLEEAIGDGRSLTQHETDILIAHELHSHTLRRGTSRSVTAVLAPWDGKLHFSGHWDATRQRGGIHSDPLVRLLAFRAWGDRDRTWRKRDTARAIARDLDDHDAIAPIWRVYGFDGLVEYSMGEFTANRNGRQATARIDADAVVEDRRDWLDATLDCFDDLDAKLSAGGEPVPSGPLTFGFHAR